MAKKNRKSSSRAIPEEFFEHTNVVLLLKAEADAATETLTSTYETTSVKRDIGDAESEFTGVIAVVAQPLGNDWSLIFQHPGYLNRGLFSQEAGRQLSAASGRLAMLILTEDCSGAMDYEIFDNGESVERFASEELIFRSTLGRSLSIKQLEKINPYQWIDQVVQEVGARVPLACLACTENHCRLLVTDSKDWAKVNAASLTGDDLPDENFTTD